MVSSTLMVHSWTEVTGNSVHVRHCCDQCNKNELWTFYISSYMLFNLIVNRSSLLSYIKTIFKVYISFLISRVDQAQRKSPLYICLFVMSLSFVLLFFSIAIIMTDGYYTACKGYKKAVIKHLSVSTLVIIRKIKRNNKKKSLFTYNIKIKNNETFYSLLSFFLATFVDHC